MFIGFIASKLYVFCMFQMMKITSKLSEFKKNCKETLREYRNALYLFNTLSQTPVAHIPEHTYSRKNLLKNYPLHRLQEHQETLAA